MSAVISPSILAETPEAYKEQVDRITGFAERVHIDVTDGLFAPTQTVGLRDLWAPQGWQIDVHAMVKDVAAWSPQLIALRPHTIILHAEADGDVLSALQQIKQAGIRAGVALLRPTVPRTVAPLIQAADHVMIFCGELGRFGGTASMMQLEKVRLIKEINASAEIGWDGGVMVDNAYGLVQGGVDVLVVGGAIQKASNPHDSYQRLQAEVTKTGVLA